MNLHHSLALRYRLDVIRGGKTIPASGWRWHMITDAGQNWPGSNSLSILTNLRVPILGENVSPTPVRRDGGSVLFTMAGGTNLNASGNFFSAADVGRLFKFGTGSSGAEYYILGYTDAQNVTLDRVGTVAASAGVVWYVNTAAILTPITGLTWSAETGAANNYSTAAVAGDVCIVTHQTVRVSSAFAAAKTVTEIAFSAGGGGVNANVFDRDVIQPGVPLLVGDQARVTVQLVTQVSGVVGTSPGNVGTGCDTSGTAWLESLNLVSGMGWSAFQADGSIYGQGNSDQAGLMEPSAGIGCSISVLTSAITRQGFSSAAATNRTSVSGSVVYATYTVGSLKRDASFTFSISQANGLIYGYAITQGGTSAACYYVHKFTTPFTKANTQTLSVTFTKSWARVLTN